MGARQHQRGLYRPACVAFTAVVKPRRTIVYAAVVAASFQALIATDLEVQPLAGSEQVGGTSSFKLGSFYNPVEEWLGSGIEEPVEDAKRKEVERLRSKYGTDSGLPSLRSRLDDLLATESSVDASERAAILKQVDGVIAKRDKSRPATVSGTSQ
jgi:hypothetical protein